MGCDNADVTVSKVEAGLCGGIETEAFQRPGGIRWLYMYVCLCSKALYISGIIQAECKLLFKL